MTATTTRSVTLLPKLPASKDGVSHLAEALLDKNGKPTKAAREKRIIVVEVVGKTHDQDLLTGKASIGLAILHAEALPPELQDAGYDLLRRTYEQRDTTDPTLFAASNPSVLPELHAEFGELADALGVEWKDLAGRFADYYEHPVESANEVELREFIAKESAGLPAKGRPVETLPLPGDRTDDEQP